MSNAKRYLDEILIRFKPDGTFKGAHQKTVTIDPDGNFPPMVGEAQPVERERLDELFSEHIAQLVHSNGVLLGERDTLRDDKERQDEKLRKAREKLADKTAECSLLSQQLLHAQLEITALQKAAQPAAVPADPHPRTELDAREGANPGNSNE